MATSRPTSPHRKKSATLFAPFFPKEKLYDFMDYTRAAGLSVQECSLKKVSLEDSLFRIVKEETAAAVASGPPTTGPTQDSVAGNP